MKAAVIKSPGVISVVDVPKPEPKAGEVLLKVKATALCGTDQRVLAGEKHIDVKIVGHEITGVVESLGAGVTAVKPGQRFAVQTVIGCGQCAMCKVHRENLCENTFKAIGYQWDGGFADYMIMPKIGVDQGCLIDIPDSMTDEQGTLLEPLSCCIAGMEYMPLERMQHVVVFGAGIIGVMNGMVAKARGAKRVSIFNRSGDRLDVLKKMNLPFDDLIDTSKVDPEAWVKQNSPRGQGVDGVIVAASVKELGSLGVRLLARGGHLSLFAGMPKSDPMEPMDLNLIHYRELNIHGANSSVQTHYLQAREMMLSGKINLDPLVTHRIKLADFQKAIDAQRDRASGSMKIVVIP
jgi:L-iditol 2-dehydrogenase